ncbi:MAG TPA: flagellar biosynthetic protein FliR, partial [Burkholderiaceae bacterium]|nr:flagellar biosynthetic protein FliR [Burkholderiaceae bacterium]
MISFTEAQLVAWLGWVMLPFFRILALFSAAPVLSQRAVPMRARVGLALLVAGTMAPSVTAPPAGFDPLSLAAAGFIAQEVAVGLAIGFVARLLFAAFDLAGEIIGLQMGLSFAGFFTPQGSQGNAVGSFLTTSASLIFVAMNGPLLMIAALLRSFTTLPIGNVPFEFAARFDPLALGAEVFALGLVIALPFMALI